MPNARTATAVRLEFAPGSLAESNPSGVAFAGDEACGLDRPRLLDPDGREALRRGGVRDFPLADLRDLHFSTREPSILAGPTIVLYDAPGADR